MRPRRRALGLAAAVLMAATPALATEVIVAEARLVSFADEVEALGTLQANESVTVAATVTERVSAIHFDDGDRVEAGQLLLELAAAEQRALLQEARVAAQEAQRQFQRVQSLVERGSAAASLLDERRREWQTGQARLAAIEARLEERIIRAPFDGVVGLRGISAGALVEPGDAITTLDDVSVMKLDFPVPTPYLSMLAPGLPVRAAARAFGDRVFQGEVKSVASRADPVTRSVMVRALVPNGEGLLKPGMLMRVTLLRSPRQALVIPEEALTPRGESQFVLVVDGDGRVERREVTIGGRRPGQVEVLSGLQPGERVITHGGLKARPGETVTIKAVDDGSRGLAELLRGGPGQ